MKMNPRVLQKAGIFSDYLSDCLLLKRAVLCKVMSG